MNYHEFTGITIRHAKDPLMAALTEAGLFVFVDTSDWRWKLALGAFARGEPLEAEKRLLELVHAKRLAVSDVEPPEPMPPASEILAWLDKMGLSWDDGA